MKVVVVDDDDLVLYVLARSLRRGLFEVEAHGDPVRALESLRQSRPDLLVTDMRMPGMDGLMLAEAAKALHPGLPVLLITAHAARSLSPAQLAHIDTFLEKPCGPSELVQACRALVQ